MKKLRGFLAALLVLGLSCLMLAGCDAFGGNFGEEATPSEVAEALDGFGGFGFNQTVEVNITRNASSSYKTAAGFAAVEATMKGNLSYLMTVNTNYVVKMAGTIDESIKTQTGKTKEENTLKGKVYYDGEKMHYDVKENGVAKQYTDERGDIGSLLSKCISTLLTIWKCRLSNPLRAAAV